jgi:hypothetical protein
MESNIIIGTRHVWGNTQPFGLSAKDRRQHLYLIGQTGTGKSTLLQSLLAQDIANGAGCALIDPHGDLFDATLRAVPPRRIDDVVTLQPADLPYSVGWNPFYRVLVDERPLMASNLTAAFRHVWRESWGPRLEYILFNAIAAVLDAPDHLRPTILSVPRLLVDERYRSAIIQSIRNPQVKFFWMQEFPNWNSRLVDEALSPVQNKVGALLSSPALRNTLGQWRSSIDIAGLMDERKIVLVNLERGALGEDKANLLGSLLIAAFQAAALKRATLDQTRRHDFHLYVDEFHCFGTDIFVSILSEARKFGLSLTVAHQYLTQLPSTIAAAVLGNVGNLVCFRVGAEDAAHLSRELGDYAPRTLRDLDRGEVCVRLLREGTIGQSFLGRTLNISPAGQSNRATILAQTRQRYAAKREIVEGRIAAWLNAPQFSGLSGRRESL